MITEGSTLQGHQVLIGLWQKQVTILLLGIDNSGKTTLLRLLKDERFLRHLPMQHPTSEEFTIGRIKFRAFDLGGRQIACRVWRDYYTEVKAVVHPVDVHDRERPLESKHELDELLSEDSLAGVPFLILGNKIDVPYATSEEEVLSHMGLGHRTTGNVGVDLAGTNARLLEVFMRSLVRRRGFGKGFRWLSKYIQ